MEAAQLEISEMQPQDIEQVAALERRIFSMPWSADGFLAGYAVSGGARLWASDRLLRDAAVV